MFPGSPSSLLRTVRLQCVSSTLCISIKIMPQMDKSCMNSYNVIHEHQEALVDYLKEKLL